MPGHHVESSLLKVAVIGVEQWHHLLASQAAILHLIEGDQSRLSYSWACVGQRAACQSHVIDADEGVNRGMLQEAVASLADAVEQRGHTLRPGDAAEPFGRLETER